ncbi:Phenazine biosynthesis PhzF protein [Penicillium vulpinum]|uniref:Phenazine biosynthesis protein n=1 Tax=Penicillium vulpinum TaxID=29845 RepID=A0A1V6RWD0_9EURO|nr:Phenazine biosynthesis PhzF protein [Penicillium vulpinum]KAJ5963684.1 Phenazine biosynthesis PhzF protein [Penicillium vulpinum]OQE06065.1 hypothetical protein PENVUL_c020G04596 [Penicillium vulpinum]
MEEAKVHLLRVSPPFPGGFDTASVVPNAKGMSDQEMQEIAARHNHISGFVFPAPAGADYLDYEIRFSAPYYEVDMCSHAMIGTVWLLSKLGMMPRDDVRMITKGGHIEARIKKITDNTDSAEDSIWVEFFHPKPAFLSDVSPEHAKAILSDLDISRDDMEPGLPIQNVGTHKVKTLLAVNSVETLNSLELEHRRVKKLCNKVKSTALYVYAIVDRRQHVYEARQVPRHAGYWEDTASALAFVLLLNCFIKHADPKIKIRQGSSEGRSCETNVRFRRRGDELVGTWIGGTAEFETEKEEIEKEETKKEETKKEETEKEKTEKEETEKEETEKEETEEEETEETKTTEDDTW